MENAEIIKCAGQVSLSQYISSFLEQGCELTWSITAHIASLLPYGCPNKHTNNHIKSLHVGSGSHKTTVKRDNSKGPVINSLSILSSIWAYVLKTNASDRLM
jgi:hypothetical protein